jgi:hypothetical protein
MFWRRLGSAVAVTIVMLGPLGWFLLTRVTDRVDRALANDWTTADAAPIDVLNGQGERLVPLWRVGPGDLSPAESVELLMATYGSTPTLTGAELRVGSCIFRLAAPIRVSDGARVALTRVAPCSDDSSSTAEFRATLGGAGRLALWTWQMPADRGASHDGLSMTAPEAQSATNSVIRGRYGYTRSGPAMRRGALVAWLWNDASRVQTIAWLLSAALAVALGVWLLAGSQAAATRIAPASGAGLVALGLAVTWAVVMPPLQGADEPDHLLSFGMVAGAAQVDRDLPAEARRVHFERIRFHADERLAPVDREQPYRVAWTGDIHAERMDARSPVTVRAWALAGGLIGDSPLPSLILNLRLFNAVVFAICVAASVWFVLWTGSDRQRIWLVLGLGLVPTVPYFATMVSDWAYLVSWSLLFSGAVLALVYGGSRLSWVGAWLGISVALLVGTSIAAIVLVPLILILIAGRLVVRRDPGDDHSGAIARFWGGMAMGCLLGYLLMADLLFQRYDAESRASFAQLLGRVNAVGRFAVQQPWVVLLLLGLLAGLDAVCARLRTQASLGHWGQRVARLGVVVIAGLAVVQALASLVAPLPQLAAIETRGFGTADAYAATALGALLTGARLTGFDHLTFTSLWGGFGWVDAILPAPVLVVIVLMLIVSLVTAAASAWRATDARPVGWLVIALAGGVASAAAVAVAAFFMHRNLHGRYLLPVAIPMVCVVVSALGAELGRDHARGWRWVAVLVVAAIHGVSFVWVAGRYF